MNKIQSWQELPFNKYIELSKITTEDDFDKTIEIVAILNNMTIDEVRALKAKDFQEYASGLEFLSEKPDFSKSTYQWRFKDMDAITMDEFITYEKLKGDENSMSYIVSFMTDTPEAKIKEMSSTDVLYAFFLLKAHLDKFIKHFNAVFTMGGDQGETEQESEETSILAQELNEQKKYFNQQFGFHKMVKDVSEYTMTPFFVLMDKSAIEVLFIVQMMLEESELNQFQSNRREN